MDFGDDFAGRHAAAFAADEWDHAVGAAKIAAVLNFQRGAGVIRFAAQDGGREEFGAREDVGGEDFGERAGLVERK